MAYLRDKDWTDALFHPDPPFKIAGRMNLSWPDRGNTAKSRAEFALNKMFGRRIHPPISVDILTMEFEQAIRDAHAAGLSLQAHRSIHKHCS